jgi:hypothetical protein
VTLEKVGQDVRQWWDTYKFVCFGCWYVYAPRIYRQHGGGKRPASQSANRLKKKPAALGLLHKKNPLQGELPERAAPHAQDIYTYPFDVLTHPVFDAENMQGPTIRSSSFQC